MVRLWPPRSLWACEDRASRPAPSGKTREPRTKQSWGEGVASVETSNSNWAQQLSSPSVKLSMPSEQVYRRNKARFKRSQSHSRVATTGTRTPEERGRNGVLPLDFWYTCSSHLTARLNLGPREFLGFGRLYNTPLMARRPSRLLQKRSWPREEKSCLVFSLANTSMVSACLSRPQWPKLETEKQTQGGYYCY